MPISPSAPGARVKCAARRGFEMRTNLANRMMPPPTTAGRHDGVVRWYKPELGFGFITVPGDLHARLGLAADQDLFVHAGGIQMAHPKTLLAGDRVEFEIHQGSRGPRAIQVRVIAHAPEPVLDHLHD